MSKDILKRVTRQGKAQLGKTALLLAVEAMFRLKLEVVKALRSPETATDVETIDWL